jgi:hypothetical protein
MKTFKEVKVGDIICSLLNKEIAPIKITEVIQNYSECCKIAFKADVIDLNVPNRKTMVFIYNDEVNDSLIKKYVSTDYELLKNSLR